jgi:hypothetical protein
LETRVGGPPWVIQCPQNTGVRLFWPGLFARTFSRTSFVENIVEEIAINPGKVEESFSASGFRVLSLDFTAWFAPISA